MPQVPLTIKRPLEINLRFELDLYFGGINRVRFEKEIEKKNLAIISHPDAGKTTPTEKFLSYGGAIISGFR